MKQVLLANKIITIIVTLTFALVSQSAFAFTDLDGKSDDIINHLGNNKWTVVEVWSSDCHECRKHMPEMVKFDGKLKNLRIVGVTLDSQEGIEYAEDFIMEFGIKFPTIVSNMVEMNIWMQQNLGEPLIGTPTFILFDPDGKLVAAQPGIVSTASLETFIVQNSPPAVANIQ